jgi:hypothetical protein
VEDDPTTQELRLEQLRREQAERDKADRDPTDDGTEQHEARASKAEYLREKLEERAESEKEASEND